MTNADIIRRMTDDALIDKVIAEITNMSIRTRITVTDILDIVKAEMCLLRRCNHIEDVRQVMETT